jgi:hypothetical protein
MGQLFLLIALVAVVGVLMAQSQSLTHFLDEGSSKFERWADCSIARVFGLPLLASIIAVSIGKLTGHVSSVAQFFAVGFVSGILYSVAHAIGGRTQVRLVIQMVFMTFFFGVLLSLIVL